jgi:FdhD protein
MLNGYHTTSAASHGAVQRVPSLHWSAAHGLTGGSEEIIVEAALCLEISYFRSTTQIVKTLGITMRTPSNDEELALGFLLGEGVITALSEVQSSEARTSNNAGEQIDTLRILLAHPPLHDLQRISRAVTTTSACGLCGRTTLEGLPTSGARLEPPSFGPISSKVINQLPESLRTHQTAYARTGGCHGAALCNREGEFLLGREDVGRHNAVDKLFGAALLRSLPLPRLILVLSGRASFELVQKSASAGVALIVAVGAPSSAAIELAHTAGITLVGFTRENRFNIYTHAPRIVLG